MKMVLACFLIIMATGNIFPQSNTIKTGLYLVIPRDSCAGRMDTHSVVYSSDTLCLEPNPVITVSDIESCLSDSTTLDGKAAFTLNINLKKPSALRFQEITAHNVGNRIAMMIDHQVVMAAVIRDPITYGRLTISGEARPVIQEWEMKLRKEMGE